MQIKLPLLIASLLLLALAGGGAAYFVILNQQAPDNVEAQERSRAFFAPKERLPTTGGQQMQPRL